MDNGTHENPGSEQPSAGAPAGEIDLLDFVEGTISPEREGLVLAVLRTKPELGRVVAGMRRDCVALRATEPLRAPAGLIDCVEATLEREALLGLSAPAEVGPIPVSMIRPTRVPPWRMVVASRPVQRVALAACLCFGLGFGVIAISKVQWSLPRGRAPIARADGPAKPAVEDPRPGGLDGIEIVSHPDAKPDNAPLDATPRPEPALFARNLAPAPRGPITAERALELARLGRLAVRVRSSDRDLTLARLDRLAQQSPDRFAPWQSGLPALAATAHSTRSYTAPRVASPEPTIITGPGDLPNEPGFRPIIQSEPLVLAPSPPPEAVGAYMATLRPRDGTLRSLLSRVRGSTQSAEFIELAAPLAEMTVEAPIPAWWLRPASRWAQPVTVPVLVDRLRK